MAVEQITNLISEQTFGIWFLIGAALVFWMQAGFAMVETGFTRAKNAGNIIMKNLYYSVKIYLVSLESLDLIYLQLMIILIFQVLYLT